MGSKIGVTHWKDKRTFSEDYVVDLFAAQGLKPYRWSNAANDVYAAHAHPYHKVLYVVRGSITFKFPKEGREYTLHLGDRLDIEKGILHSAVVGEDGVVCLEAHRG